MFTTQSKLVLRTLVSRRVTNDDDHPDSLQSVGLPVVQLQRRLEGVTGDGESLLDADTHHCTHTLVVVLP